MRTSNGSYDEAIAREAQARADMVEREAAKRRNEDFVRQSRPGSYLTTESAEAEDKRLAAEGWRRGAFGTLSRDTGAGTESLSYGMDGTARYGYYPTAQPATPSSVGRAGAMPQLSPAASDAQMESSMYDQMREVEGRVVAAGEERDQLLNDGLVAAMRFASDTENSGRLPQSACKLLTRQFGMDGVKSGILDAGYVPEDMTVNINGQPTKVKKGSFGITLAGRDQAGNVTYNPMFLSPTDVYAVMNANRSQFSDEQIAARRDALLQSGYSEKELSALVDMNFSMNRARGRAAQMRRTAQENEFNRRMKMQKLEIARMEEEGKDRRHLLDLIASADSAKKNGMSENDFVVSLLRNKVTLDALMQSDRPIYEDKDGNEVSDPFEEKNGQRVLRKGVNIRRDDNGNEMYKRLSPEQAAQRARDLFVRADDGGRGAADAVWSAYSRLAGLPHGTMPQAEKPQVGGGLAGTSAAEVVSGGGSQSQYGLRNDGKTYKGTGWLGELKLPNGGVATEYTMQSDAVRGPDGNRIDFPTLVPTLTKAEQDLMVNDIIPNQKPVPDEIAQKAVDFAKMRLANGQSVFANDGQPPAQAQEVRQNDEDRKRLEAERERLLAAKEARAKSRNAARTVAKASGLMKSSGTLAQETTGTNSNMNRIAENTSAALRQTERNYDEMPMTPEERRANAISDLKRWRAATGRENEISDEAIERMADEELKKQM